MQNQTPVEASKKPLVQPDALDAFEDFDFKPLTEGLGFHHENKAQEAIKTAARVTAERPRNVAPLPVAPPAATSFPEKSEYVQSDLALFYGQTKTPDLPVLPEVKRLEDASPALRLAAFFTDLVVVLGMVGLTVHAVAYLTGLQLWSELFALEQLTLASSVMLFVGYFLLYFTLSEKVEGRSLGKELFNLKLEGAETASLARVFLRSSVTLVSFLSFGLLSYVDLQRHVSGLRVVRA